MTAQAIINEIESRTSGRYNTWHIGLASNPEQRRQECEQAGERTDFWMDWRADSMEDAKEIETRYANRGMKLMTAGQLPPHRDAFVFIF
jgi:hypothetical protein